jgi:hypothetical protein
MAYHRSLLCIALVLLLLREAFANLIQWPSITTKQLTTVFEDSTNVITENCGERTFISLHKGLQVTKLNSCIQVFQKIYWRLNISR